MTLINVALAIAIGALAAGFGAKRAPAQPRLTPPQTAGHADLREAAKIVEQATQMPGFAKFAESVAVRESNFKSTAINDSASEAAAAGRLYHKNSSRYGQSGYAPAYYTFGSGGWYGFLPAVALASPEWNHEDPRLIFTPIGSTMLLASFVQRVARNHFGNIPPAYRTWLTIRRFMSSNRRGYDWAENLPETLQKRVRYAEDLARVGLPSSFMHQKVPRGSLRATPAMYDRILSTMPQARKLDS